LTVAVWRARGRWRCDFGTHVCVSRVCLDGESGGLCEM